MLFLKELWNFGKNDLEKFNIPFIKWNALERNIWNLMIHMDLHLEIVEREEGEVNTWTFGGVTPEIAIKGFGGATLIISSSRKNSGIVRKSNGT